jgi:hypothetical protein
MSNFFRNRLSMWSNTNVSWGIDKSFWWYYWDIIFNGDYISREPAYSLTPTHNYCFFYNTKMHFLNVWVRQWSGSNWWLWVIVSSLSTTWIKATKATWGAAWNPAYSFTSAYLDWNVLYTNFYYSWTPSNHYYSLNLDTLAYSTLQAWTITTGIQLTQTFLNVWWKRYTSSILQAFGSWNPASVWNYQIINIS